uniref:Uncharacterized protein n=1 Tax=Oreochromis aureus TaxID=47969 RepID=A0A668W1H0_OREAU
MAAQQVIVLLALASLGVASKPDCKELVKPLVLDSHSPKQQSPESRLDFIFLSVCWKIYGKWVLHVASWDDPGLKDDILSVNSSWLDVSASSESGVITIYWADRLNGNKCLQGIANATISGMTSHTTYNINGHTSYHDGKYYETCSNCLLSEDTTLLPDGKSKGRYFFLFTRTGALEASELETFKNQAECLKFPSEYHFTSEDLCPDDRATASTAVKNTEKEQPEIEPNVQ